MCISVQIDCNTLFNGCEFCAFLFSLHNISQIVLKMFDSGNWNWTGGASMVVYTLQRFSSQPLNISERKKLKTLSFSLKTHTFENAVQDRNI